MEGQMPGGPAAPKSQAADGNNEFGNAAEEDRARGPSERDDREDPAGTNGGPLPQNSSTESNLQAKPAEKQRPGVAISSQPQDDPNRTDPNERSDMISERPNPGSHGGGGDPGWKPSRRPS